jgi:hypothetical protein
MKKHIVLIFMFLTLVFSAYGSTEKAAASTKNPDLRDKSAGNLGKVKLDTHFGRMPLYFISNNGQVNKQATFYAKTSRYTLWLTKQGLVFDSIKEKSLHSTKHLRDVSRLIFANANKNPEMVPVQETKLRVNYFIGNDRSKWHCNIPTSQAVLYKNLYKNINLKVYGIEKQIEYDWIVKPGGNPRVIRFAYKNIKATRIDNKGNLLIETDFGRLMHKKPVCYQRIDIETRIPVNATFKRIAKDTYGFEVGKYDKRFELIIDPVVLAYSTYLGGGGTDDVFGLAVDNRGNVYLTGHTNSMDFPTLNKYQGTQDDKKYDAYVTKIDTTQSGACSLIYSTYLGGRNSEYCFGIAVDNKENAYITGMTMSTNFPTLNQYQTHRWNDDAFVTRLDTTQSGASSLIYSTYLGGGDDDFARGIAVDINGSGYVYVTGNTVSRDFPTLDQYQTDQPVTDAFLTKLDTNRSGESSLIYSTYLGGGDFDYGTGIAVDANCSGYAYVTGYTDSWNFPIKRQYQADQPYNDVFVTTIDTTQSGDASLIYSTYLGGESAEFGNGIAVDANISGYAYVTGYTASPDFPTRHPYQEYRPHGDAFVTRLDTTRTGDSSLVYSTFLGGEESDYAKAIAVDANKSGIVYVTGYTYSLDFPTLHPYQESRGVDVFVTKLDTNRWGASALIYSTYLGGWGFEIGFAIAADSSGYTYVAGFTKSSDFPILNQYQTDPDCYYKDGFVTKLINADLPYVITRPVFFVTTTSASGGGNVTSDGGSEITARGICWSISPLPTLSDQFTTDGTGTGIFNSFMTGLTPNTIYYVRAYATNAAGTAHGNEKTFKTLSAGGSLTVTSPNGGEIWKFGSTQNITWTSQNVYGRLMITLWKKEKLVGTIARNIKPASGSYAWKVGFLGWSAITPGNHYKIKIKETGTSVSDMSDNPFMITLRR